MKKTASAEPRTPLFDRLFKPETITLANGHTVQRPRSRTPLITLIVVLALGLSVHVTGFDLTIVFKRANQLTKILGQIFQPDPSFFAQVMPPLMDTMKMRIKELTERHNLMRKIEHQENLNDAAKRRLSQMSNECSFKKTTYGFQ